MGCYGQKLIKTPHLDAMAKEGVRFTQAYCRTSVCAPSRTSLMIGKHMGHSPIRANREILIVSSKKADIPPAGCALAVATLVDCRPMSVLDEPAAQCRKTPKAVAWVLENIWRIKKPFPVQGELGLFDVDVTGLLEFTAVETGT